MDDSQSKTAPAGTTEENVGSSPNPSDGDKTMPAAKSPGDKLLDALMDEDRTYIQKGAAGSQSKLGMSRAETKKRLNQAVLAHSGWRFFTPKP